MLLAGGAALLLSSCASYDNQERAPISEKDSKQLAKLLDGKVAGEPMRCLSHSRTGNFVPISDDLLLIRVSKNLVYKNDLRGRCNGLARNWDVIVTKSFGSSHCQGDTIKLVDRVTGLEGGFCSFGEFTPYRTPKK
ncbi:hypothetical protein LPB140_11770 [Sphingorhabdus lutea]|uniref:Uncharacterized protein n=1 Tax=Sphingorhabdus lutea TaxID=1913578 RepID=A0A1L3JFD5_9SPHN|nr:hypothetical protein LPB140_11770 [Sphingorhabdus lutea]